MNSGKLGEWLYMHRACRGIVLLLLAAAGFGVHGRVPNATPFSNSAHEAWTYDPDGNEATHTRPNGQVFTQRYDALNRHVEETIAPS